MRVAAQRGPECSRLSVVGSQKHGQSNVCLTALACVSAGRSQASCVPGIADLLAIHLPAKQAWQMEAAHLRSRYVS